MNIGSEALASSILQVQNYYLVLFETDRNERKKETGRNERWNLRNGKRGRMTRKKKREGMERETETKSSEWGRNQVKTRRSLNSRQVWDAEKRKERRNGRKVTNEMQKKEEKKEKRIEDYFWLVEEPPHERRRRRKTGEREKFGEGKAKRKKEIHHRKTGEKMKQEGERKEYK